MTRLPDATDSRDELTLTAWHEAGHAIAYLACQQPFRYVTIRPRTHDASGLVAVRPGSMIDLGEDATIAYCGPLAQGKYHASTYGPGELTAAGLNEDRLISNAFANGGCGDLMTVNQAEAESPGMAVVIDDAANKILDSHWATAERIADALLERGTLQYHDAKAIWWGWPS